MNRSRLGSFAAGTVLAVTVLGALAVPAFAEPHHNAGQNQGNGPPPSTTTTVAPSTPTTVAAPTTTTTTVAPTTTTVPAATTTTTTVAPPTTTAPAPNTTTTPPTSGSGIATGIYVQTSSELQTAINELGRTPAFVNAFYGFSTAFPQNWVNSIVSMNATPMMTWQPELSNSNLTSVLTTISSGALDSYISGWAQAAKAVNHVIYIRLMHEMNGDWYPWGAVVAGSTPLPGSTATYPYSNTPAMYVAAYRHVVSIFQSVGANNVKFVWNISSSAKGLSAVSAYYPGDAYVTWPSMDGYNKSSTTPKSFSTIFTNAYAAITAVTAKPIMVAETASVEYSGLSSTPSSKAAWITDAFQTIPASFPQIKAVEYYDAPGNSNLSFAIDSSSASLAAIRQAYNSPQYQARAN